MTALHNWYIALPWSVALAILCGAMAMLALVGAVILQRSEPNAKELRLARKRDRAEARLKAHMRAQRLGKPSSLAVGRDAFVDKRGVWK